MSDAHGAAGRALRQVAALVDEFNRSGDRRPLDSAVGICRAALRAAPPEGAVPTACRAALRSTLVLRWSAFRDRRDLDESITEGQALTAGPAPDEQDFRLLGRMLADRHELTRDPADLAAGITALRRAAELPMHGWDNRPFILDTLGGLLAERGEATGDPADLAEAEHLRRVALALLPEDSPELPTVRNNLAASLRHAAELHRDPARAREAVELLNAALADTPAPHRPQALLHLATACRTKAELTGAPADVEAMVAAHDAALAAAPRGHPLRAPALSGLGVALRLAAEHTDDTEPLRAAVALLGEAVGETPEGSRARPHRLNSLGNALHRLGQRTGDATLLDESVRVLRAAVAEPSPQEEGHLGRVANLALALRERYHQTGDLETLREAAHLARPALNAPRTARDSDTQLANLGVVLQTWYDRTGDADAAAEAVEAARRVLARTPPGGAERAMRLNHLGNALFQRYRSGGDPADLAESAAMLTEAVERTAYGTSAHADYLHNLGLSQLTGARAAGDPTLLNQAVTTLGRSVWASAPGAAPTANRLQSYASALRALHAMTEDPAVLLAAEDAYRQVAGITALPAAQRVRAAYSWGIAAADAGRWEQALDGFELALALLPFSIGRRLTRDDQEHGLTSVQGLAADAAACAVHLGRLDQAVLLLEQGRGVLLGRTISARAELERLREAYPEAADRFMELRDLIDALDPAERDTDERHVLAARWQDLVTEIRTLPGFGDFLDGPTTAEVRACAGRGPVVLVYASPYRSDALVLLPGRVLPVPLPGAGPAAVEAQARRLGTALADAAVPDGERAAQETVAEVLAWTWDHVTGPVLDALRLSAPPTDGVWPRLWWSPGGPLAALPLHASGHHGDPSRTVLDRAVSSYTPTVRALAYARARAAGPPPAGRVLAVVVPDAPGARRLGGVRREVRELSALLPTEVIAGPRATFAGVMAALPAHPYVHFACHGVSEPDDPSGARLLVHDHQENPLTVRHISRLELPDARLAVLSACETARGSERLADESIHITSAFQTAGYPHAIGTLWPVHDAVAVRVTRTLYGGMRGALSASAELDAALALHHAVRECRAAFPGSPSLWAAHVHSGA
ncbi:CHAT domain-containing protein [Streptomyces griseoluteus]|uniref:CHAT domain-containing protein n=1 Tax=Streptomyces griseoluteus TaxID=29306 RepID=A0A4Z1D9U1_STRGP|nr:CHAT domain-containing protein [Streptomyces griseoluteus]TGN78570.1 CHAT domain-containing protein [Streptomyces griseoluteus]GHE96415.1 CHAT domain-containing protein [Streptomyces griseoluteus]